MLTHTRVPHKGHMMNFHPALKIRALFNIVDKYIEVYT